MGIINAWKGLFTAGKPASPEPTVTTVIPKRRIFQGATKSRLTANWVASAASADAELKGAISLLRQRSRDLVRNNPHAKSAIRTICSNVIGPDGIKLQSQIRRQRGGKLDQKVNESIEMAWREWGHYDSCHTAGRLCFKDIERLCCKSLAESGEVFIRLVKKPFGRSKIPLGLEILESDQLDDDYTGTSTKKQNTWRMGIELDSFMRPIQYAFLTKHPGDTPFPVQEGLKRHMLIPADEIIHLYLTERPGQTRGIPWMSTAIKSLHHLDGFAEASVIRARASSALMGFITSPEGELDPGGEVYEGDRVTEFSPGMFSYLSPGQNVSIPDMDSPSAEFEPFMRAMLRSMASGIGLSYESLSRDYSTTNYSSSRLALIEDRAQYRTLQNYFIENFHNRVFENFLDMAVLSGALSLPTYDIEPERYKRVRWIPRSWDWVDPLKECQANKEAVKAGFKTQAQVLMEQGYDLEEVLNARKSEVDQAEELGLKFDTNVEVANSEQLTTKVEKNNDSESNGGET